MGKYKLMGFLGAIGAFTSNNFGGWDSAINTLIIFMSLDYITGFLVAAVFKKSSKSKEGTLKSEIGFKGLFKKSIILTIVFISVRLDLIMNTRFIRDTVIIAYIVNETISIIENVGLMGIPIPKIIKNSIEALKKGNNHE